MENGLGIDFRNTDSALWGQRTEGSGGGSAIQREDTKETTLGPQRNNHPWASHSVMSFEACEQFFSEEEGLWSFSRVSHPKHEKGSTSRTSQHCTAKTIATLGTGWISPDHTWNEFGRKGLQASSSTSRKWWSRAQNLLDWLIPSHQIWTLSHGTRLISKEKRKSDF